MTDVGGKTHEAQPPLNEPHPITKCLYAATAHWTLDELDKLIWALERDSLHSEVDMARFIASKTKEEVERLFTALLGREKQDQPDALSNPLFASESQAPGESTIEIIQNSIRCSVPPPFSPGPGISSVLRDLAESERHYRNNGVYEYKMNLPDYAVIYEYISDLLSFNRLPRQLDEANAAALLDMVICLLQATDFLLSPNRNMSCEEIEKVFEKVNEHVAVLVAAVAAAHNHKLAFLRPLLVSWGREDLLVPPSRSPSTNPKALNYFAPLAALEQVNLPETRQGSLQVSRITRNLLEFQWSFPRVESGVEIAEVRSQLAAFMMNPLGLDANAVLSVNQLFATTDMLMHYYTEMISPLLPKHVPSIVPFVKDKRKSAAQLLASALHSTKGPLPNAKSGVFFRPVSLPITKSVLDKQFVVKFSDKRDVPLAVNPKPRFTRPLKNTPKISSPGIFARTLPNRPLSPPETPGREKRPRRQLK